MLAQFVGSPWQYGLLAMHRNRPLLVASATGLATSVIASLILIPQLQARGAAIAFSTAELVIGTLCLISLRRALPSLTFSARVPVRVIAAAALAVAVALLVPGLSSLVQALVAMAIYAGVLALTRAVPRELFEALPSRVPAEP